MAAGSESYWEIDHLGGKDEGAHHSHERNAPVRGIALGAPRHKGDGRDAGGIKRRPNTGTKESIGDVHWRNIIRTTNSGPGAAWPQHARHAGLTPTPGGLPAQ